MKPTPLLDFWQKPADAGDPVAVLATTFALEPDFFEQNCLARFLEVSSVDENSGSVEDIVARVELHELLRNVNVTVLADRSAPVERTSLQWDLLGCKVDGGLLHAKVAVLLWERKTRVVIGSANLTSAGYRRQIELGLAADLGTDCLLPHDVLVELADELESYLELVPGHSTAIPAFARARSTLALFRQRLEHQSRKRSSVHIAFAPTNARAKPLDRFKDVLDGSHPIKATHLSPFWDSKDPEALQTVRRLLTGRPAENRSQHVAVVPGPGGETTFAAALSTHVSSVHWLKEIDKETRLLHAKCLLLESKDWISALVGSSNHTKAGWGLSSKPHREINIWIGAPIGSKEGKALRNLVQLGDKVPEGTAETPPVDEDESRHSVLPGCFGLCRVIRSIDSRQWHLHLGISDTDDMPSSWIVGLDERGESILSREQWEASGKPASTTYGLKHEALPMYVLVSWNDFKVPWTVIADDQQDLPPSPALSSLRAQHLLNALARGCSLAQILREELERKTGATERKPDDNLDPLKRFEVHGSLLRKGRALATSLDAMKRRIERPVITIDTLRARLASPLGPVFVATKVVEACEADEQTRSEAMFTVAEIALTVGRVKWPRVFEHIDRADGKRVVSATFDQLDALRARLGNEPSKLATYARNAFEEARKCLSN